MNKDEIAKLVEGLRALYVWPQFVADHHADVLLPRQTKGLYDVGKLADKAADALTTLSARVETLEAAAWKVLAYDQLLRKVGEIRAEALLAGDMPNVDAAYDDMVKTCVNTLSGKTGGDNG